MGQIRQPQPVKLFIGILCSLPSTLEEVIPILENKFGKIEFKTSLWPFNFTDYYNLEMGSPLWRQFISFQSLINPQGLKDVKIYTNEIEGVFTSRYQDQRRPVNLDPGYLNLSKVVLATTKDYSHRLYLGDGIYAEVTLHYYQRQFRPYEWTYPDYQSSQYLEFFGDLRKVYRQQLCPGQKMATFESVQSDSN